MATSYTGDPTATRAPASAPSNGVAPIVVIPSDGDALNVASITQEIKVLADYVAYTTAHGAIDPLRDGSDANPAMSSTTATLTRDMFYANLTMANSTINTAGFRVIVQGLLSMASGSIIQHSPNNGGGSATQGGAASGTLVGGADGGLGQATNGDNGTAKTISLGGAGGNGGAGSGGTGGTGGGVTAPTAVQGSYRLLDSALRGAVFGSGELSNLTGGGGGGGGGGDGGAGNGFGGGGGGVVVVACRNFVSLSGANFIKAIGAKGQDGASGQGGGGGGGGGAVFFARSTSTITGGSLTLSAAGGAKGTGGGAGGVDGTAGSAGQTFELVI